MSAVGTIDDFGEPGLTYTFAKGKKTASANTAITTMIPPKRYKRTKITEIQVTTPDPTPDPAVTHVVTFMRPLATTTTSAAAAASQAVVALSADPGDYTGKRTADNLIAANDYLAFECPDGTYYFDTVSSVASLNITMTNNFPTLGIASGAKVWFYGVTTDTDPNTGEAHPVLVLPADSASVVTTTFAKEASGHVVCETVNSYEPIIVHDSNDDDHAGQIEYISGVYGSR